MPSHRKTSSRQLIKEARAARSRAHAPFSHFRVGAALLTTSGKIIRGCNVENSSYGLTVCAERVAVFSAVSQGHTSFVSLAISTDSGIPIPPCGACRQVLADLSPDMTVILDAGGEAFEIFSLSSLLPRAFRPEHLKHKRTLR